MFTRRCLYTFTCLIFACFTLVHLSSFACAHTDQVSWACIVLTEVRVTFMFTFSQQTFKKKKLAKQQHIACVFSSSSRDVNTWPGCASASVQSHAALECGVFVSSGHPNIIASLLFAVVVETLRLHRSFLTVLSAQLLFYYYFVLQRLNKIEVFILMTARSLFAFSTTLCCCCL